MNSIIEIISNWINKNNSSIKYTQSKNTIEIIFENVSFKIIIPEKSQDFITIDSDYNISWLDKLNMIIIEKNYEYNNLDKILTIIYNQIKKDNKTYSKRKNTKIIFDDMKIIDENEIKVLCMKKKISDLVIEKINNTNTNIYISNISNTFNKTDKKIFDKDIVLKIIGDEFINLYTKSFKTNKFKIDLNDNNINSWKVLISYNKVCGSISIDNIEFNISFNQELYPNYPPKIVFVRPKLKNSLSYKLSNLRMLQLEYWSPARSVEFIINKLYTIINKFNLPDLVNINNINTSITNSNLENALINLCNHFDQLDENLDDEVYKKNTFKDNTTNNKTNDKYWKSGTGYGHRNEKIWDVDAYLLSQKQKDIELLNLVDIILKEVSNITDDNKEIIRDSYIMKYFNSKIEGNTLFEMNKHNDLYMKYADILIILLNFYSDYINNDDLVKFNIIINEINNELSLENKLGTCQDEFSIKYRLIHLFTTKILLSKTIKETPDNKDNKETPDNKEKKENQETPENYKSTLEKYNFFDSPIIYEGCKYFFKDNYDKLSGKKISYQKRMVHELGILRKSVPIDYRASIYVAMDPENISVLRVLITGPHDTPYDSGCFIFDIFIPEDFPNVPPLVYMLNTGNVRFNPNLYNCGKVCLSILGTWSGDKSETWNKDTSSLLQVFMSIQSLILIDEPYFNEPGYESSIGTPKGKEQSYNYNNKIRMYTMKYAIAQLITSLEYPQFIDVIKHHFRLKKDHILKVYNEWVNEAPDKNSINNEYFTKKDYELQYNELKKILDNL